MNPRHVVPAIFVLSLAAGGVAAAAPDTTPPTAPTNVRVTATSPTSVTVAWGASTDNSGRFHYVLQPTPGYATWAPKSQTSRTISGLWPQSSYSFTVQAVDDAGNRSPLSNSVSVTTPPDTSPPSAPTLTVGSVEPTRVAVSWTPSVDNVSMVQTTLLVNGSERPGDGLGRTGDLKRGRTQVLLDLPPSTSYSMVVLARDAFGNAVASNTVTATTPPIVDTVAPSAPANLRGRDDGGGCEAYLSWDLATDDTDAPAAIMYRLYAGGVLANTEIGVGRTVAFEQVLGPGTTAFVVEAVDGSGNTSAASTTFPLAVRGC